jgi:hypothetical protein
MSDITRNTKYKSCIYYFGSKLCDTKINLVKSCCQVDKMNRVAFLTFCVAEDNITVDTIFVQKLTFCKEKKYNMYFVSYPNKFTTFSTLISPAIIMIIGIRYSSPKIYYLLVLLTTMLKKVVSVY